MDWLLQLDSRLFLLLNGSDSFVLDKFWWTVTQTVTWIPLLFLVLYVCMKNSNFRQFLLIVASLALCVLLADQFSSTLCKPYFHRLRPSHDPQFVDTIRLVNGYEGGLYGFVSSHAANSFAVAVFLALVVRHWLWSLGLFSWALLTSYSRIYLGVHFPGDILCGALLGTLVGLLVYGGYYYFQRRINTERKFYSSAYTSTGFVIDDVHMMLFGLMLTLVGILLWSVF